MLRSYPVVHSPNRLGRNQVVVLGSHFDGLPVLCLQVLLLSCLPGLLVVGSHLTQRLLVLLQNQFQVLFPSIKIMDILAAVESSEPV